MTASELLTSSPSFSSGATSNAISGGTFQSGAFTVNQGGGLTALLSNPYILAGGLFLAWAALRKK